MRGSVNRREGERNPSMPHLPRGGERGSPPLMNTASYGASAFERCSATRQETRPSSGSQADNKGQERGAADSTTPIHVDDEHVEYHATTAPHLLVDASTVDGEQEQVAQYSRGRSAHVVRRCKCLAGWTARTNDRTAHRWGERGSTISPSRKALHVCCRVRSLVFFARPNAVKERCWRLAFVKWRMQLYE